MTPVAETAGAILVDRGRVLLGLRARHKSYAGCWDIIGGHVEPGETVWGALCRELVEELGLTHVDGAFVETMTLIDGDGRSSRLHVHVVSRWRGDPVMRDDEHEALRWFGADEAAALPNLVTDQYRRLFATLAARPLAG